jgi:hypothetical protein
MKNEKQLEKELQRCNYIIDYFKANPDRIDVNRNYLIDIYKAFNMSVVNLIRKSESLTKCFMVATFATETKRYLEKLLINGELK